jgi:ADP-ribose pyrophosphatase YjhB (NUDIX family)
MQIIKTFNPQNTPDEQITHFEVKRSVRAVMLDSNNNIGLIYSSKLNYHTLPGGGIEKDETYEQATVRECKEETGYP